MLNLRSIDAAGLSLVDWLCFAKQDSGLQELREEMGNEGLLRFLSIFPGIYLKMPSSKELARLAMDLELADCIHRIRIAKKMGNLTAVVEAEQKVAKISAKLNRKYEWGLERGKEILAQVQTAKGWIQNYNLWKKRNGLAR